jgi:multidrug efflux pump subunit AcrB
VLALVHLTGNQLSMPVFIGILMLLGIVAKNSILLDRFRDRGNGARAPTKFEPIIEAGHKRAQPIVMTTVAMVAGMMPTALSLAGDGAGARRWASP